MGQIPQTQMTAEESALHDKVESGELSLRAYSTKDWPMSDFITAWFECKDKEEWRDFADAMRAKFDQQTGGRFDPSSLSDAALNQRLGIYKMHLAKLGKKAPAYPERPQPETLAQLVEMGIFDFESL